MATLDKYNIGKVYEEHLKAELIDALTASIVDKMMAEFKEKAEAIVKAEASKIVIDGAAMLADHAKMQEELIVYLRWADKE